MRETERPPLRKFWSSDDPLLACSLLANICTYRYRHCYVSQALNYLSATVFLPSRGGEAKSIEAEKTRPSDSVTFLNTFAVVAAIHLCTLYRKEMSVERRRYDISLFVDTYGVCRAEAPERCERRECSLCTSPKHILPGFLRHAIHVTIAQYWDTASQVGLSKLPYHVQAQMSHTASCSNIADVPVI